MDSKKSLIDDVINTFDFQRVYIAMTAVDWQWQTTEGNGHAVPSIARLKAMARHLLRESIKNTVVGSGGFEARYYAKDKDQDEYFQLRFTLAESNSCYD